MFGATLYIISCSARNRLRARLRRLREPRYLVGAVIGIGYLTFTYLIRQSAYDGRAARGATATAAGAAAAALGVSGSAAAGVLLACLALVSWVVPIGSSLLEFSQAETAFLFPSPMTRRQLVLYRLLRSQSAVLVGALIMALAYPTGSVIGRLRGLASIWVLLMTSRVFYSAVTLARARVPNVRRARLTAWPVLLLCAGAVLSLLVPLLTGSGVPLDTASDTADTVLALAARWPASWLLWPFTALVRPLFAESGAAFVPALAGALVVYGVSIAWLMWVDGHSPEAAESAAERTATAPGPARRVYAPRPAPWRLAPQGRPEAVFLWKGLLQSVRTVDRRVFVRLFVIAAWLVGASLLVARSRGLLALLGVGATWGALFSLFMGPQMLRMDLRQDLGHLELLKTWPVKGAALVRGQLLWPVACVTAMTWVLGLLAILLSLLSAPAPPSAERVAIWLSFLALAPGIVVAEYTMHNAVALFFPGWVPLGPTRARGVDAAGQRLIWLVANWLGLTTALLPGALVTAGLWLLLPDFRPWTLLPGAVLTTAFVGAEAMLVSLLLGRVFDRLDLTSVERGEI